MYFLRLGRALTRTTPVGYIYSARRTDGTNAPGIVISSEDNAYMAIAYKSGNERYSYVDFDNYQVLLASANGYPINFKKKVYFSDYIGANFGVKFEPSTAEIYHSAAENLVLKASTNGIDFLDNAGNTKASYYANIPKWQFFEDVEISKGLSVTGSKNSLQKTTNYGDRLINAYETAEYYFGDIGSGIINSDGECVVYIDEILQRVYKC